MKQVITLMSEPFAFLDKKGLGSKSHKVSLDNQGGVLLAEEERWVTVLVGLTGATSGAVK